MLFRNAVTIIGAFLLHRAGDPLVIGLFRRIVTSIILMIPVHNLLVVFELRLFLLGFLFDWVTFEWPFRFPYS